MSSSPRREQLMSALKAVLEETSGLEISSEDTGTPYLELGLDSLFLTQFALAVGRKFQTKISLRQLAEDCPTMDSLADFIEATLPPESPAAAAASAQPESTASASPLQTSPVTSQVTRLMAQVSHASAGQPGSVQSVIEQQLKIMAQQIALLGGVAPTRSVTSVTVPVVAVQATASAAPPADGAAVLPGSATAAAEDDGLPRGPGKYDVNKAFGAIARITVAKTHEVTPKQKARLDAFIRRYNEKTKGSKRFAQETRHINADPRVVTGFRPVTKELVYPLVVDRSAGSKLWDIDGNEYVDALNGFGMNLFGWQPEFVTKAIEAQLRRGHEIGPQHPLTAEVAKLICDSTGFDRAGFCNTGSEAVMGCMRIARTVTGRSKIAIFSGSYHGIFDEVLVRGTKKLRSIPAAPGIMPSSSENVLVLDYGTEESLAILKSQASELAAIMVEPVQSRRPDFQPREFLHALRELTTKEGIVYIFDEVVTGFRKGPGGAQEYFDVKADLASYGKVLGGGLPFGVIAGKREFMDALDGGYWQFGDDSVPPVGVTYFAGTFVRHPLALAAAKAVLTHLKEHGRSLQDELSEKTAAFVQDLNAFLERVAAPIAIKHFGSLWKTFYTADQQ
ncbi:MAG TPA: aminotransferase class III-fold pyridoxal phosphate-dependent enzyme, partial [Polyangiaceae bacterium]